MSKVVLGLDLGPNSIGWALVNDDPEKPEVSKLIDLGVRVFPEGVDAFDTSKEQSRNESRRQARGMRRQIQRRARRQRRLAEVITTVGLWPEVESERERLLSLNPYELRARGLREKLEPFEFGRVLLHLNQRRGFLSNRKKDRGDKEVQGMLAEINANEREREEGGFATIGEMLAEKLAGQDHTQPLDGNRVRRRHLARAQYESEFEHLWAAQAKFHPKLLTDTLKHGKLGSGDYPCKPRPCPADSTLMEAFGLHGLIFFQRKMYWPKSVIGLCELEPKQKRCPRADRQAQRFRLLQEINNLKYIDPDAKQESALTPDQRTLLLDYLGTRDKATFDQIRKKLGFLESVKFNLERGNRSSLKGMVVDWQIAKEIGKDWHDRPDSEKDAVVRLLIDTESDENATEKALQNEYGMTSEQADAALGVELPSGYVNLSLVAIDRLLPHLEKGLVYQSISDPEKSALHAAGYLRRDELQRRLFDVLPDPARVSLADCKLGDIPNPVVKRTLVELRQLVNAIIREYSRPDEIHVEMARSIQMGPKRRSEYNSRIREREKLRENAADNLGRKNRDDVNRYLMWKEQGHECIYCGEPISQQQLFGGEVDVDHILPYSRCLDDSQLNKVVCHRHCNDAKGKQTPYEWLAHSDQDRYSRICQQVGSLLKKGLMPYPKYRRFLQKELKLDDFIARQLVDTGYIARATVEYLKLLFDKKNEHAVLGLKGQLTAELRWHWGLETVISELPDSPAWHEQNDLRPGEKNRADHRHHAVDAIVLALTNRKRLNKLSQIVKAGGARKHGEILEDPWEGFRDDVKGRIRAVKVSHRVERKVRGALHEETLYGPTQVPGEWVVRKPVEALSANEIERIRDKTIRDLVIARLTENGIAFGRGKKPDTKKMKAALVDLKMPSGVPVRKVRIIKPELTIRPIRSGENVAFVKPGSLHHLCIFEWEVKGKKKREAVFVTMLEAINRLKQGEVVVQRTPPTEHERIPDDARFVMSLSSRELVLAKWKGEEKLLTFKSAASTQGQIYFADSTDARRSNDQQKFVAKANTLKAKKVTVDPLGRIRWAKD